MLNCRSKLLGVKSAKQKYKPVSPYATRMHARATKSEGKIKSKENGPIRIRKPEASKLENKMSRGLLTFSLSLPAR